MDGELAADNTMQSLAINRNRERNDYSVHDESNFKMLKQRSKIHSIFD